MTAVKTFTELCVRTLHAYAVERLEIHGHYENHVLQNKNLWVHSKKYVLTSFVWKRNQNIL